jgi:prepilin-type N-terminal cleavage/methylation domain-containing protein
MRRSRARGFTMVELMVTIAIMAVLSLLAGVGMVRYVNAAKVGEATTMISRIKMRQEVYRAERTLYYDISAGNLDSYWPAASPVNGKVMWVTVAAPCIGPCVGFLVINALPDGPVQYRYSSIAGPADAVAHVVSGRTYPLATSPWYVVKARGDLNGNGVDSQFFSSSWENGVWSIAPEE